MRDAALHGLLVGLVASLFGLQLLADLGWAPPWLPGVMTVVTLGAGIFTLAARDALRLPLVLCAGLGGVLLLLDWRADGTLSAAAAGFALLGMLLLALSLLRLILAPGPVRAARVEGAVALYLVMALFFATAYELVERWQPGAFHFASSAADAAQFRYFSIVAQTSTGFGDIVPRAPLARTLAMIQAVSGQMFIAVLLARLVALELAERR